MESKRLDALLESLVSATAPELVASYGVGTDTAGALLVSAGDNPERLRSEAAFAHLCGVAPIDASSGLTIRKRLNRGGDRSANHALWRIVMVRMVFDARTRAYVARRTAEGRSKREIIRSLKRYPESTDGLGCAGCRARNGRFGGCGSGWWRWQGATVAVRACGQEETAVGRRSQACWRQAVERSARPSGVRSGAGSPAAGRGRR